MRRKNHSRHSDPGAVQTVLTTAQAGARELVAHGMPHAARAVATTAAATAMIGNKVHGWAGPVLAAMRGTSVPRLPARASSPHSSRPHKSKAKKSRRSRLSPAQWKAIRKMQRARKASLARKRGRGHRKGDKRGKR